MLLPTVVWAQRTDRVYLTIDLQDVKDQSIKLDNDETAQAGVLTFTGKAGAQQQEYALELRFYGPVEPKDSKISVTDRNIFLVIMKTTAGEHWPRLTKESSKGLTHIKVDWDKWVDEDEEGTAADKFDMNQIGNFQGFDGGDGDFGEDDGPGGDAGDAEDDSDDEDLPDLAK